MTNATTMTATEILENLRNRIADGDTTITPAELQQAEAAVQFAQLQTEGQQKRNAAAAHQARLEELTQIRNEVEHDLPNVAKTIAAKLAKIDQELEEALTLANEHDRKILTYSTRIRSLAREGASIEELEATANGILAGSRIVGEFHLDTTIRRAAQTKADYPSQKLTLAEHFKPVDRAHVDNNVTVRILKNIGAHEEGDTIRVLPSVAQRMIKQGNAEAAA